MRHDPPEETDFIVEVSNETFETWINRSYIPIGLRPVLSEANVLIVPKEGFRDYSSPVFPLGTEVFFDYLKENARDGMKVDVCIPDEEYKELALHSDLLILGGIIVTSILCPIIADLVSEYIKRWWKPKEEKAAMKVEITVVENDGRATRLLYEGSAKDFLETVKPTLNELAARNRLKSNGL